MATPVNSAKKIESDGAGMVCTPHEQDTVRMSIDDKMLGENAWLEQKVSALIAERESLVVLNASLAEKNNILHAKLTTLMNARDDLHATLREALGLMELAAAKEWREREEALHQEALESCRRVQGRGRARAEEWAAIKKGARATQ